MTQERPVPARPWYDLVVKETALRGWTKTELSDRSGVARTTIDNWSTNRRKPSAKAVNAVADTLGIDRAEAHVLAGIVTQGEPETDPVTERIRAAFINAGYPPERADYFTSVVIGVRDGTLTVTRRQAGPGEDQGQAAEQA